jgi:hypothetical protein
LTKDDETNLTPQTKDAKGKYISTPTAADLAQDLGITGFHDNAVEYDENGNKIEDKDDDSPENFWFLFSWLLFFLGGGVENLQTML